MKFLNLKKSSSVLLVIFLIASLLRFAGLSWGLPYHFHPDEWNMANAVSQLSWEDKLNPHFFAYGQLPLYLAYFSARIYNLLPWIHLPSVSHTEAAFFLRFWSVLAGLGSVFLVYLLSKRFLSTRYSLLAALLAAFTPGLIQIAHFGTTESLLTFFFLLLNFLALKIIDENRPLHYLLAGVGLGLALGTKISAVSFVTPLFWAILWQLSQNFRKNSEAIGKGLSLSLVFVVITGFFFFLSSPHFFLDFQESSRILTYETQVASGQIPVFYTRQFFQTSPIIFQLLKIFPYALGWPILVLGLGGLLVSLFSLAKSALHRHFSPEQLALFVLINSFLAYFASQSFLFCKWTRFIAPLFPFFAIFAATAIQKFISLIKNPKRTNLFYSILTAICISPGLIFGSLYFRPDIRLTASEWIIKNLPPGARVLSEGGNVIDLPIQLTDPSRLLVTNFDFYRLDEDPQLFPRLVDSLNESDFILVPSRRLFANHSRLPQKYPLTARYFQLLFSGQLGFEPIKTFFPFGSSLLSDESAEETWSVFDHPVIRVFQKKTSLTRRQYEELFKEH